MTVLSILQWLLTSNNIINAVILITFIFSILFKLLRGN